MTNSARCLDCGGPLQDTELQRVPCAACGSTKRAIQAVATDTLSVKDSADAQAFSHLPDEHPIFAKIGRIAAGWALVEHALDQIIWDLRGGAQVIAAYTTSTLRGAEARTDEIRNSLKEKNLYSSGIAKQLSLFVGRSAKTSEERNRIVHDAWYQSHETGGLHQFRTPSEKKKTETFGIKPIDDSEVAALIVSIGTCLDEARALRNSIVQEAASKS